MKHLYIAAGVAQAYLDNVFKLYGLPVKLVSDRDSIFTSQFWTEMFK